MIFSVRNEEITRIMDETKFSEANLHELYKCGKVSNMGLIASGSGQCDGTGRVAE